MILRILWLICVACAQYRYDPPKVKAVNAMCSSEGITASLDFDRSFNGKIYSLDYANVHECIYYNTMDMDTVLFSIPAHRCGTKLSRTTRNVIDQMENRVYVQMDKDTQTAADKQFSFVCQLATVEKPIAPTSNDLIRGLEIRRHPVSYPLPAKDTYASQNNPENNPEPIHPTVQHARSMDAYAAPPFQTNLLPLDTPVLAQMGHQVPTVSAVSTSSAAFGNWPIPGSIEYNPGVPQRSSMPKLLAPQPLVPSTVSKSTPDGSAYSVQYNSIDGHSFAEKERQLLGISQDAFTMANSISGIDAIRKTLASREKVSGVDALQALREQQTSEGIQFNPLVGVGLEPAWKGSTEKIEAKPWSDVTVPSALAGEVMPKTALSIDDPLGRGYPLPPVKQTSEYIQLARPIFTTRGPPVNAEVRRAPPIHPFVLPHPSYLNPTVYATPPPEVSASVDGYQGIREPPQNPHLSFTNDLPESQDGSLNVDRMIATQKQETVKQEVFLEIQLGNGPNAPTVGRPVKIGENITLVVRSKSMSSDPNVYDMFVHSCFATDGPGTTKVELIDKYGCVSRPAVVSSMQRKKDSASQISYFFGISAFKFPGPDDVYFSCSVELTPRDRAPEICAKNATRRARRSSAIGHRLFDNVKIELEDEFERDKRASVVLKESEELHCMTGGVLGALIALGVTVTAAFFVSSLTAIQLHLQLRYLKKQSFT
ncbi:unnamed protein product, partial [Mesorhabditis belari]|uniref:ZP domain-containing protein n=1 Tax=Mesorhabditis belari TaxID=2138241 RepID=A0AAF3EAE2_9BILA